MKTTSPKLFCFVIMPFNKTFDDIYNLGIKGSCNNAGIYCERVDEQIYTETILERIYNQISKADLIVADMSGKNPNVFYEVGYAHALNKPTILLTQNVDDIPFDLKYYPHIVYEESITYLNEQLTKKLNWLVETIKTSVDSYKTELDIYVDDQNIGKTEVVHEYQKGHLPTFEFTLHNNSSRTFHPEEFQIGIITSDYDSNRGELFQVSRLPDKSYLHMITYPDLLFPGAYTSTKFIFSQYGANGKEVTQSSIIIRVFTANGSRDYPLTLKRVE